ncbi:MAG: STAS/SEC14 domain-containing protein [Sulfuricellaceae bacterium]|nr:STAS/SEC14 domain-containing protein [Sulfuricellaceae bacterium]
MITVEHHDHVVKVSVFGEFTLTDYKQMEDMLVHEVKFQGKVSLLIDLRDMADFTLDVAWEDVRFNWRHPHDFKKIAVVTEARLIAWSAWLARAFVDAEIQVFENYDLASDWVDAGSN